LSKKPKIAKKTQNLLKPENSSHNKSISSNKLKGKKHFDKTFLIK